MYQILCTIVLIGIVLWIAYIVIFGTVLLIAMVKGDDEKVDRMLKWALLHG